MLNCCVFVISTTQYTTNNKQNDDRQMNSQNVPPLFFKMNVSKYNIEALDNCPQPLLIFFFQKKKNDIEFLNDPRCEAPQARDDARIQYT